MEDLGLAIKSRGSNAPDIRRQEGMARSAVQQMGTIWRTRGICLELKVRLLCFIIFPIATYEKDDKYRVKAFESRCYRRIQKGRHEQQESITPGCWRKSGVGRS